MAKDFRAALVEEMRRRGVEAVRAEVEVAAGMAGRDLPFFARRLRQLRRAAGLSLRALAAKAGLDRARLSRAEGGKRAAGWDVVEAVARALGTSLGDWQPPPVHQRLQALRSAAGLTLYALAQKSGLSQGYLGRLDRGASLPSWDTVERLSAALGADLGDWQPPGAGKGE